MNILSPSPRSSFDPVGHVACVGRQCTSLSANGKRGAAGLTALESEFMLAGGDGQYTWIEEWNPISHGHCPNTWLVNLGGSVQMSEAWDDRLATTGSRGIKLRPPHEPAGEGHGC